MKSKKLFKKINFFAVALLGFFLVLWSCKDDDNGSSYNPNQPVVLSSFHPDSGGVASKVIIEGRNFGTNPEDIKVYYNEKRAAVIGASGEKIYVLTPRQPGDTCDIAVVIGKDSIIFDSQFRYKTSILVSTVASKPNSIGDDDLVYDGTLAEVSYKWLQSLAVDAENNIFVHQSWPPRIIFLNEKLNRSISLYNDPVIYWQGFGQPAIDAEGRLVLFPNAGADWDGAPLRETFYMFDPSTQWATMIRNILHPSPDEQSTGIQDFSMKIKSALAFASDGTVWTRENANGQLVRFSIRTRKGELMGATPAAFNSSNQDPPGVFMLFHPVDHDILYLSYPQRHCICTYNIKTGEHTIYAGKQATTGYRDGNRLDAEFNQPRQFAWDMELNLYIADASNHVIRKITPEGMVSTVVGMAGISGYQDGNPEDALFNQPSGLAIDSNGDIYITDNANMCVRKLSIQ